jgi:hypothetical protein
MHVVRETPSELVIKDSTLWLSAVLAIAGIVIAYFSISHNRLVGLPGTALFLLVAALFARKLTFSFSVPDRVARWQGRKLFKSESGSVAFDDITGIGTETTTTGKDVLKYRLMILTNNGSIPMAYVCESGEQHYARLRVKILRFVHPELPIPSDPTGAGGVASEAKIRSLLHVGRKIDAIELLRSSTSISLSEATQHVEALDAKRKAGG